VVVRPRRRRDVGLVLALCLAYGLARVAAAAAAEPAAAAPAAAAPTALRERFDTVVLDAGHGGDDEGARANGLVEKDLVLDVARRLRQRLEHAGLRVVMTRDSDVYVPLERRTAIANDAGADLFISIHANAAPARAAQGIETFFLSLEASDEAASQVAQRENAAFRDLVMPAATGDDPLLSILGDLAATEQMQESDEFARLAQHEVAGVDRGPSRGVKQAPFVVLMGLQMPASLVEIGFVTNAKEAHALAGDGQRDRVADALARAVHEFGRRYDARRGVLPSEPDAAAALGGG
jgi:N-acetylmuramoyl-L-alanine amidase